MIKRKPWPIGTCDACGKPDAKGFVVASAFGPCSNALCTECIETGREVYDQMVDYIAMAGRWPDDINDIYQEEVRHQLKLHNRSEEEFAADVEREIEFFNTMPGGDF
jgi:hypothetical protein